ncbi:GDSL-type esterase/lipase family protein [Paracoccus sp. (in: a-proteobacteria)]|uniref:GDSL-type esterase/lipase family protein n=1 Tax=Paracoccus sp. TaxID=267 RepID=UPI0026E0F0AA|nr:GDSL-type esterase/lipase family protein [Paracoccus sp. (in: a-proteobacteria)]MDO5647191.1 GDSL-type esterase/lipase family protein [Paracoccus sp. (in: a-proteobacteria)]
MIGRRAVLAGLACAGVAAAATPPRILFLGDSLGSGFGLPDGAGLIPQLSRWLADHGSPAHLIDAALNGDTTFGGRVRLPFLIRRHRPDAVIIALGGNDMLMGWPPGPSQANLATMLRQTRGRPALLVGVQAPPGDAAWRADWAAIWPHLAEQHSALMVRDIYAPLMVAPGRPDPEMVLADGLHPSAKGVRRMTGTLGPSAAQLVRSV